MWIYILISLNFIIFVSSSAVAFVLKLRSYIDNIIFYFPHRKIGGVSNLFIESAKLIKDEFNTFLADYKNGQMAKNIPPNVKLLDVETITKFPENSLIIFQSFHLWNLRDIEKFPLSTKFL